MKISCFLTSFNRPTFLRRALASIKAQTHQDYELFVLDESDLFDINEVVRSFDFGAKVTVCHWKRTPAERAEHNPMSWKLNRSLSAATGGALVFLCDDDYFYPGWFDAVSLVFDERPQVKMVYGILKHEKHGWRSHPRVVLDPLRELDHCQVAHRRIDPPATWPEEMTKEIATSPDGYYFRDVQRRLGVEVIEAVNVKAVVKGHNQKSWLKSFGKGPIEGLRE